MFDRRPPVHWLDPGGSIACGVGLTPKQFETRANDGSRQLVVTCERCCAAMRRAIRHFAADPSTEAEEGYVRQLQRMLDGRFWEVRL